MSFQYKHALLAGTAILAVGAFAPAAQAAVVAQTLTGNTTWAIDGDQNQAPADGTGALTGDTVNIVSHTLTVMNDSPADNGEGANTFTLGAVTGTTGTLIITTDTTAATDADLGVTVASMSLTNGSLIVRNQDNDDSAVTATFTGAVNGGTNGFLTVENLETSTGDDVTANFGSTVNFVGASAITAGSGNNGGASASVTITGNATFGGSLTVTGGAGAAANTANLTLLGATNTFGGPLTLDTNTGVANLNLNGAVAQTVTLTGGGIQGDGTVNVGNTAGVIINGDSTHTGAFNVNNNGNSQTVRINGNTASAITLGDNAGTDTVAMTFGSTGAQAISGTITGGGADTSNLIFTGGNTKTLTGIVSAIDNTTISSNTTVTTNQDFTSTNILVESGSTLAQTGNIITATALVNNGTVRINGTGFNATLTGTGLLDIDGSAGFTGAITQGTADIAAAQWTQNTALGWNVGSTNFSGAGTLALAAGSQTVAGNFTNTTDANGTITVANGAGTTAFTGNVGASTSHSLAAFDFQNAGPTAQTVTATGNWFVDATRLDASDELAFIGTSAQTVSGTIAGYGAGEGVLAVGNGVTASDVTFNSIVGGTALNSAAVNAGATARYNANATFTTAYSQNATGKTYVGQGSTITADSFSNAGSYYLNVIDANGTLATGDFGHLADSSNNGSLTASRLNINLTGDVGTGTVQLLTGINAGAATLADNSIQYSFTTADNGTNTDVTVARTSAASLASGTNNVGVAAVLDSLNASTDTQIAAVVDSLAAATSQSAFNEILESVGPTVDGGAVVSGFSASVESINVTNTRLAALRDGSAETGMVAGDAANGMNGWVQGFGHTADQDDRNNVNGYESDTYGAAVGLDTANILDQGTLGVALSYANTDVDSRNANTTNSEVDSYQVSVYGDYDVAPSTYVSGMVGFAWNEIDQTRHNVGGIAGLNARADYDSNQYIAYAEVGHDIALAEDTTLTPHVLAHYQHIAIDDYSETGAGGLSQNVRSEDLDIFELGIGAELAWELNGSDGSKFRPALSVGYRHDLVGDDVSTTSNFTGGGASFNTNGLEPAQGTFNIGASLGYATVGSWEFLVDYDFEAKSDYDAHSGKLRAGYKF